MNININININIIVAHSKNYGIGFKNMLPWKISSDLKKFKKLTIGNGNNAIIMGKNTFESIKCKSLKSRDNLILSKTSNIDSNHGENITKSFNNITLLEEFVKSKNYDEIWIIGGAQIYEYFLNSYPKNGILSINKIVVTYVDKEIECDTFFPKFDTNIYRFKSQEIHETQHGLYDFSIFDRVYVGNCHTV